jgi:hypothetical protein
MSSAEGGFGGVGSDGACEARERCRTAETVLSWEFAANERVARAAATSDDLARPLILIALECKVVVRELILCDRQKHVTQLQLSFSHW